MVRPATSSKLSRRPDILAAVLLALLAVALYFPLTIQGRVLASFDAQVYFYPHAAYLADRLRQGQVPLWDPYLFAGVPFLANSQVGALYPPSWLYLLGPVSRVYAALVVVHVWLLALGVYLLGRLSLGLRPVGGTVAAICVAFGGFTGGMVGHLNQLEAFAWLPFAVLAVERAVARSSWRAGLLAAVPFALLILAGHSQVLYFALVVAALTGGARIVERCLAPSPSHPDATKDSIQSAPAPLSLWERVRVRVVPGVALLAVGPGLSVLIAGAQLVPLLELTRLGIRSEGLDFADAAAFSLPPPDLLVGLLPTTGPGPSSTEWYGWVGLGALVLAAYGLRRRPQREAWWLAALAVVGLVLALGQYTPLYQIAFDVVPGLRLFRVPARWLTLWTLGVGLLAGWGMDSVGVAPHPLPPPPRRGEGPKERGGAGRGDEDGPNPRSPFPRRERGTRADDSAGFEHGRSQKFPLPLGEGQGEGVARADAAHNAPHSEMPRAFVPSPVATGEGQGEGGVPVPSPVRRVAAKSPRTGSGHGMTSAPFVAAVALAALVVAGLAYHYRHVIVWPDSGTLGMWIGVAVASTLAIRAGRWNARVARVGLLGVVVAELAVASLHLPIHDAVWPGAVEARRPALDYLLATGTSERILALGDNSFDPGDLANVRAMLDDTLPPAARDAYVTAIKHVEGQTPNLPLSYGLRSLDGYDGGVLPLESFNLLKRLFPVQGKVVPDGRLQLQLTWAPDPRLLGWLDVRYLVMDRLRDRWINGVYYDLGVSRPLAPIDSIDLPIQPAFPSTALGVIVATGGTPPRGTLKFQSGITTTTLMLAGKPAGEIVGTEEDRSLWLYRVPLRQSIAASLAVSWQGDGPVTLRSLSLIDERTGANQPVVVDPAYQLAFLGDLKIYENQDARPRAFLATGLQVASSPDAVLATMRRPGWDAGAAAVASDLPAGIGEFADAGPPGTTRIVADAPERVVVETSAPGRRVLVLTDSFYPGWRATVDGRDAAIVPVDLLFRGVVLSPGQHTVVFVDQPGSWTIGLALSAIGILGLAAGLALLRR